MRLCHFDAGAGTRGRIIEDGYLTVGGRHGRVDG